MKKLEQFFFRYYSYDTLNDDRYNWLRYVTAIIFLIPVVGAVVLDLLNINCRIPLCVFMGLFLPFCVLWIVVWFYHNWRIRKL